MTTAQQVADRIHEALGKYDAATNGRDEARAIGLLMAEATPEALRALLAERDELRKALRDCLDDLEYLANASDSAYARPDDETIAKARAALNP